MPPRGAALIYLLGDLLTVVLACLAIYWSLDPVLVSWQYGNMTNGLRVIRVWFLIAVPFGFTIMLLRLGQSIWRDVGDLRYGRPPRSEEHTSGLQSLMRTPFAVFCLKKTRHTPY